MGAKQQQSMRVKEGVSALLMHFCCSDLIHSEALNMAVCVYSMIRLLIFASRCWEFQCLLAALSLGLLATLKTYR